MEQCPALKRNIKLVIEYEGTEYEGWQVQGRPARPVLSHSGRTPRARTIQETLEMTLERILRHKVRVNASGRTDAGVHARSQTANFLTRSEISCAALRKALNSLLPQDICVSSVRDVPAGFHSRFSAKGKLYRYTILNRDYPSALARRTSLFCDFPLSAEKMKKAAASLEGTHDFKSFQTCDKNPRSSVRTVRRIKVKRSGSVITIDIEANGFLKNMARAIVGTLIEIGRGRFPVSAAKRILGRRDRNAAGPTAPACGLCLVRVTY